MNPQELTTQHLPFKVEHPSARGGICTINNENILNRWKKAMERWPNATLCEATESDRVDYVIVCEDFLLEKDRIEAWRKSPEGRHMKRMANFNH